MNVRAQLARHALSRTRRRHNVRHQLRAVWRIFPSHDHHLAHLLVAQQHRLDLPQLNPEAPHLHLGVYSPDVLQRPVRRVPHQVSRPVQPRAAPRGIGVRHEALRRHSRTAPIAARQSHSSYIDLTHDPARQHLPLAIQNIGLGVIDPSTQGSHPTGACQSRLHFAAAHIRTNLRGAINVVQARAGEALVQGFRSPQLQRFAAAEDELESLQARRACTLQHRLQQGRHQSDPGDPALIELLEQASRILHHLGVNDEQRRTGDERLEDLRNVIYESHRGLLTEHRIGLYAHHSVEPRQSVDHAAVRAHDPLGFSRAPGRIDHIRQVLRTHRHRRIAARSRPQLRQTNPPHPPRNGGVRHHQLHSGIRQQVLQPCRRIARVQRHITAAGLQNPQHPRHHLRRPLQANADARFHANTLIPQVVGQLVSLRVQLRIAQLALLVHDRDRIRCAPDLLLEQLVDTPILRIRLLRRVPLHELLLYLLLREQLVAHHRPLRILCNAAQQPSVVPQQSPHCRSIEQIRVVFQDSGEP